VTVKGSLSITGGVPDGVISVDGKPNKGTYSEQFRAINNQGKHIKNIAYKVLSRRQEQFSQTDTEGHSSLVSSDAEEPVKFALSWAKLNKKT
jgi:hypothetical protein